MPYVVAEPPAARGVYDEWEECLAALEGVPGARRLMKVTSREEGEGILEGRGIRLDPGLYAFTDGSGSGGIGVVIVRMGADPDGEPEVLAEVASSVDDAFRENPVPGLQSANEIRTALARLKNILAEMGALYAAVHQAPAGEELTVVHDYAGVGAFMRERRPWRPRGALTPLVAAIQGLATQKGLTLTFRHQASHRSDWAGRNDYVKFNRLADELAARY